MARPIWKGSISFGLVNIPVSLYSGEQRQEMSFNLLDRRDQAHIKYKRVNEVTGKEVPWENIVKGYEIEKDHYVLLEDKDFESVAMENTKMVEITDFVDLEDIDPQYFDKPYYLVPEKAGEKGYVLLRDTLKQQKRAGIAKVVIRSRENLACVIPYGDTLQMIVLRFHEEVKEPEDIGFPGKNLDKHKVSERELAIAGQLVEAMSSDWDPEQYKDEYRAALKDYVQKKYAEGDDFKPPTIAAEKPSKATDIMELLQQSLAARGSNGNGHSKPEKKPAAKEKKTAKNAS